MGVGVSCPASPAMVSARRGASSCFLPFSACYRRSRVCRDCIMEKTNDEDLDCCPVCKIDLGCDPEEKLRPDHNLQDIRNKVFPIKARNVDSPKAPITLPAKRKQRSLSSLVVDTPSVAKRTGLTGKRTKATRRAAASDATSPVETRRRQKTLAQQSSKAATAANKKQRIADIEVSSKTSSEDRKNGKAAEKEDQRKPSNRLVYAASKTKASRSKLAVDEEQIKNKEGELLVRKKEAENEVVIPETSKKATTENNSNQQLLSSASVLHDPRSTPVWFSLVALSNQKEDPQLPQLSNNYLRVKDGSLQISSVQKYIMKKLDLTSENEVEIICHGEPISPSSTLLGLVELWLRRETTSEPARTSLGAPPNEFVLALGYRRRHLPHPAVPSAVAVPPEQPC
ncbi:hypothetical protein PVAP13_6KG388866 [Panicum virgatum]|uniref:Uncharacterized protein n=1 Tax=Panicum virgatum TaxID=38727 RepID=A0A8T0RIY2_PANVG|nr:hypothetical protein PVAP13_6KG388866 [Panicum virgatum]